MESNIYKGMVKKTRSRLRDPASWLSHILDNQRGNSPLEMLSNGLIWVEVVPEILESFCLCPSSFFRFGIEVADALCKRRD